MMSGERNVRVARLLSSTARNLPSHFLSELSDLLNNEFLHAFDRILLFEAEIEFLLVSDQKLLFK